MEHIPFLRVTEQEVIEHEKAFGMILAVILLLSAFMLGTTVFAADDDAAGIRATPPEKLAGRNLKISVLNYTFDGAETIPLNGGNYASVTLYDLADVTIDLDGKTVALRDALGENKISGDELVALARLDAAQGVCNETAKSKNGLTEFTYHYPEFSLHCAYDIYETPDGKQHLIKDLSLYGTKNTPEYSYAFDRDGQPIDYEDWGLDFRVTEAKSEGMVLKCTQSGGQQAGTLELELALLSRAGGDPSKNEQIEPIIPKVETAAGIHMDGVTELSFDFEKIYGALPAGDYELTLQIADRYEKDTLPALARKYHDTQWYSVEFTIN